MKEAIKQIIRLFKREAAVDEHEAETLPARSPEVSATNETLVKLMLMEISWRVAAGYDSRESIIRHSVNEALMETEGERHLNWFYEEASRMTDDTLRFHYRMQAEWLGETDCDRLDEAFAELDRNGVVVRQSFGSAVAYGHEDIWGDIQEAESQRQGAITGFVFFHHQDLQEVLATGLLRLSYGSTRTEGEDEAETKAVGQLVLATLRKHGLTVDWNGSVSQRISVENLRWERRRSEVWEKETI